MDARKVMYPEVLALDGIQRNPNKPNYSILTHDYEMQVKVKEFSNRKFIETLN